jgi:hypothetical protein
MYPDYYNGIFGNPNDPSRESHIGIISPINAFLLAKFDEILNLTQLILDRALLQPYKAGASMPRRPYANGMEA